MSSDDAQYLTRRLREEQDRATASPQAAIARIHLELASHGRQALASTSPRRASGE